MKNHQTPKHHLLKTTLALAVCGSIHMEAQAVLPVDAVLAFNPGAKICLFGGTPPDNCTYNVTGTTGSYFAMDTNGDGIIADSEKTIIEMDQGIRMGDIQPASGSHTGAPDGTELSSIDLPWSFFTNTGMHQTTSPVVITGGDDGDVDGVASLDFTGWGVTWNGIANIPMGGDSANFPTNNTGIAVVTCASSCNTGDNYTLNYFATVPQGDASGFGGVPYSLHLEGTINPGGPLPPTKSVTFDITGGELQECSETGGSVVAATANIVNNDPADILSVQWALDGAPAGSSESVSVFASLGEHTLTLSVDTVESGFFERVKPFSVLDSTRPELSVHFFNTKNGAEVTQVSSSEKQLVQVSYVVTDICDPAPTATGSAVPVHTVNDGDTILIDEQKSIATTTLGTSAVRVSAEATDADGNRGQGSATLSIVD